MALVAGTVTFSMVQGGRQQGTPEERAQRNLDRIKSSASITFTPDPEERAKMSVERMKTSNVLS